MGRPLIEAHTVLEATASGQLIFGQFIVVPPCHFAGAGTGDCHLLYAICAYFFIAALNGSLTLGIAAISVLTSLPPTFATLRI